MGPVVNEESGEEGAGHFIKSEIYPDARLGRSVAGTIWRQ